MRYAAGLAAAALLLAGCGGASSATDGAASLLPSTTGAFASITHAQSPAVRALLDRFPVQDPVLAKLDGEFDLAALGPNLVVLTKSKAPLAGFASKRVQGWTAYAHAASTLDALGGSATLEKDATFKAARASLRGTPDAFAFARGPQLLGALPSQEQVVRVPHSSFRITPHGITNGFLPEQFAWTAAEVVDTHVVADGRVRPPTEDELSTAVLMDIPVGRYPARLTDEIPADARAVFDFQVSQAEFGYSDASTLPPVLRAIIARDDSLPTQLDYVLGGETAIYIERAQPLVATLVTHPLDTRAALENLKAIEPLLGLKLYTATLGGELVLSTSRHAIDTFRGPGKRISSIAALDALPAATTGFVWGSGAALQTLAHLLGVTLPDAPLLLYGDRVGAHASSVLVLQDR